MIPIRISAKNLGAVALEDFCPRCFWLRLHTKALPWQIFPGIFSSIDSYTKKAVHALIDRAKDMPCWLLDMGDIVGYRKVPHFSKFFTEIPDLGITLTGGPDDLLVTRSGGIVIPDYKTAKFTANQDKLLPMYRVQLNSYKVIAEACGFEPVADLFLVYFEPCTDEEAAKAKCSLDGFDMGFHAHPLPVQVDRLEIEQALEKTRKIHDMPTPPIGRQGCKDCESLNGIIKLAA